MQARQGKIFLTATQLLFDARILNLLYFRLYATNALRIQPNDNRLAGIPPLQPAGQAPFRYRYDRNDMKLGLSCEYKE